MGSISGAWCTVVNILASAEKEPRRKIVNISSVVWNCRACRAEAGIRLANLPCGITETAPRMESNSVFVSWRASWRDSHADCGRARLGRTRLLPRGMRRWRAFDRLTPDMARCGGGADSAGCGAARAAHLNGRDARGIECSQRLRPGTYWKTLARRCRTACEGGPYSRNLPRFSQRVRRGHREEEEGMKWGLVRAAKMGDGAAGTIREVHVEGRRLR